MGGLGALGLNGWAFISQLVVFLIVLGVLWRYAFPALTRTLDERERVIREGVENAQKAQAELSDAERRVQQLLEQARQDSQATLAKATQAGERVRGEIEQEAQQRGRDIIAQTEKRIQQDIAQARQQLRQEVADLAILAAGQVVGNSLDNDANRRLVQDFVTQAQPAETAQTRGS